MLTALLREWQQEEAERAATQTTTEQNPSVENRVGLEQMQGNTSGEGHDEKVTENQETISDSKETAPNTNAQSSPENNIKKTDASLDKENSLIEAPSEQARLKLKIDPTENKPDSFLSQLRENTANNSLPIMESEENEKGTSDNKPLIRTRRSNNETDKNSTLAVIRREDIESLKARMAERTTYNINEGDNTQESDSEPVSTLLLTTESPDIDKQILHVINSFDENTNKGAGAKIMFNSFYDDVKNKDSAFINAAETPNEKDVRAFIKYIEYIDRFIEDYNTESEFFPELVNGRNKLYDIVDKNEDNRMLSFVFKQYIKLKNEMYREERYNFNISLIEKITFKITELESEKEKWQQKEVEKTLKTEDGEIEMSVYTYDENTNREIRRIQNNIDLLLQAKEHFASVEAEINKINAISDDLFLLNVDLIKRRERLKENYNRLQREFTSSPDVTEASMNQLKRLGLAAKTEAQCFDFIKQTYRYVDVGNALKNASPLTVKSKLEQAFYFFEMKNDDLDKLNPELITSPQIDFFYDDVKRALNDLLENYKEQLNEEELKMAKMKPLADDMAVHFFEGWRKDNQLESVIDLNNLLTVKHNGKQFSIIEVLEGKVPIEYRDKLIKPNGVSDEAWSEFCQYDIKHSELERYLENTNDIIERYNNGLRLLQRIETPREYIDSQIKKMSGDSTLANKPITITYTNSAGVTKPFNKYSNEDIASRLLSGEPVARNDEKFRFRDLVLKRDLFEANKIKYSGCTFDYHFEGDEHEVLKSLDRVMESYPAYLTQFENAEDLDFFLETYSKQVDSSKNKQSFFDNLKREMRQIGYSQDQIIGNYYLVNAKESLKALDQLLPVGGWKGYGLSITANTVMPLLQAAATENDDEKTQFLKEAGTNAAITTALHGAFNSHAIEKHIRSGIKALKNSSQKIVDKIGNEIISFKPRWQGYQPVSPFAELNRHAMQETFSTERLNPLWRCDNHVIKDVKSPDGDGIYRVSSVTPATSTPFHYYIQQDGNTFETLFDEISETWRIKNPNASGYNPAIKYTPEGRWVFHTDVGYQHAESKFVSEEMQTQVTSDMYADEVDHLQLAARDNLGFQKDINGRIFLDINQHLVAVRRNKHIDAYEIYNVEQPYKLGYPIRLGADNRWQFGLPPEHNVVSARLLNHIPSHLYETNIDESRLSPQDARGMVKMPDGSRYLKIKNNYIKIFKHPVYERYSIGSKKPYVPVCVFDNVDHQFVLLREFQAYIQSALHFERSDSPTPQERQDVTPEQSEEEDDSISDNITTPSLSDASLSSRLGVSDESDFLDSGSRASVSGISEAAQQASDNAALSPMDQEQMVNHLFALTGRRFPQAELMGLKLNPDTMEVELDDPDRKNFNDWDDLDSVELYSENEEILADGQMAKDYQHIVHVNEEGMTTEEYLFPTRLAEHFMTFRHVDTDSEENAAERIRQIFNESLGENNYETMPLDEGVNSSSEYIQSRATKISADFEEVSNVVRRLRSAFADEAQRMRVRAHLAEILDTNNTEVIDEAYRFIRQTAGKIETFLNESELPEKRNIILYRAIDRNTVPNNIEEEQRIAFRYPGDPLSRVFINIDSVTLNEDVLPAIETEFNHERGKLRIRSKLHEISHVTSATFDYVYLSDYGDALGNANAKDAVNNFKALLTGGQLEDDIYLDVIGKQLYWRTKNARDLSATEKAWAVSIIKADEMRQNNLALYNADTLAVVMDELAADILSQDRNRRSLGNAETNDRKDAIRALSMMLLAQDISLYGKKRHGESN